MPIKVVRGRKPGGFSSAPPGFTLAGMCCTFAALRLLMPLPDPPPPPPGETTAGIGSLPLPFTGDHGDAPAPREFIPAIARGLSGLLPVAEEKPAPPEGGDFLESLGDFFPGAAPQESEDSTGQDSRNALSAELTSLFTAFEPSPTLDPSPSGHEMTGETSGSLQSLANSLLIDSSPASQASGHPPAFPSPTEPTPLPANLRETTRAAQFSLADLAGRLSSKLNTPTRNTAIDLLGDESGEDEAAGDSSQSSLMVDWDNLTPRVSDKPSGAGSGPALPVLNSPGHADWNGLPSGTLPTQSPLPSAAVISKETDAPRTAVKTPPRALPLPAKPGGPKASSRADLPEPALTIELPDIGGVEVAPAVAPTVPYSPPVFAKLPQRLPPPMPVVFQDSESQQISSGSVLILMFGGVGLALLGIVLACTLPILWLDLKGLDEWSRHITWAAIIVRAALASGLIILGLGSVLQKRWAAPLIHASGWVGALFASLGIAGITWHWAAAADIEQGAMASSPQMAADFMLLVPSLVISLILILLYQRSELQEVCGPENQARCWTDFLPVPGMMVFVSGLVLFTGGLAMLAFEPAFPVTGTRLLTGSPAGAAWVLLTVLGAATAFLTFKLHRSALWFFSAATAVLLVGPALTGFCGGQPWSDFLAGLGKSGVPVTSAVPALLAGLCPFPFIVVLAMARRAFSSFSQT